MRTTFLILILIVCVSGCGGPPDIESNPDLSGINNVVRMVGDTDDEEGWKLLFAEGSVPADITPYDGPIFALPAEPNVNISGDTAEIEVLVITEVPDMDGDGVPDEQEATTTWTAQKVGEKWKLKSAPLP